MKFYTIVKSHSGYPLKLWADTVDQCLAMAARYPTESYRVFDRFNNIVYEVR